MAQRFRVLLISPHPEVGGGVVEFSDIVANNSPPDFTIDRFYIGRRKTKTGMIFRAVMPLYDGLRLAGKALTGQYQVFHINPSFVPRAIARDGLFALIIRVLGRGRILCFFHGWDMAFSSAVGRRKIQARLINATLLRCHRFIVLASCFANELRALSDREIDVFRMTTMFRTEAIAKRVSPSVALPIRILFLGRFTAEKGIYELILAYKQLRSEGVSCQLILAGDGDEMTAIEQFAKKHEVSGDIEFPGYVQGKRKSRLLANSHVFVLPSHREGCPIALLEAMASGLPAVVTDTGAMPDVIKNGENGYVVAIGDSEAIANALRDLCRDDDLRDAMGSKNSTQAWEKFEASTVTAELFDHYRDVAAGGSRTE